ncbi:hypothetical protein GIB67_002165 [Kingdonia uniflora]|uniref:PITH domain-containing protein n=1 Tax=Kingdonia uniflora TaxID=39325 RepID=A0A7J7KWX9_9MAGN|nr:hypothetical protein GIB67_002165 [Kingdonia uniflora]
MDQRIKKLIEAQALDSKDDFTKLQGSMIATELCDMEGKLKSNDGDPELLLFIPFTSDMKIKSISVGRGIGGASPSKKKNLKRDVVATIVYEAMPNLSDPKLLEYIFKDRRIHEYIIDLESYKNSNYKMQIEIVQVDDQAEEKHQYHMYHNNMVEIYQISNSYGFKRRRLSECCDLTPQDKEAKLHPESSNRRLGI